MKIKSLFLLLAMLAVGVQSCDEFLKEELVSDVPAAGFYTTPAAFEDAVDATYFYMKYIYSNERAYSLTVFGTDTYTNGADGNFKGFNTYDNSLNSAQSVLSEMWQFLYKGINQANAVIALSTKIQGLPANTTPIRVAEAKFLRAQYYFTLVRQWGDVHLTLEETTGAQSEANKTPRAQIYDVMVKDLDEAIAVLPATQADYGRATKAAAQHLLGLVRLTRGYQSFAKPDDFAEAEKNFTSVITGYNFSLVPSAASLWNQGNQKNSEIVFAVQNATSILLNGGETTGTPGEGNRGHLYFLMQYDDTGMKRDIANGRPFKRFRPTDYLLGLWRQDNTNGCTGCAAGTYKHVWYSNITPSDVNSTPRWAQENIDAGAKKKDGSLVKTSDIGQFKYTEGDTAVYIPGPGREAKFLTRAGKLGVRYRVYTRAAAYAGDPLAYSEARFAHISKFIDPLRPSIQWMEGSRDWFVFRLADTYLLRAEARMKQANNTGAAADINVVRTRAAWPGREAAMQITAAQVTTNFLLDERARELDAEQCRFYDLTRMLTPQQFVDRIKLYNPQAAPNVKIHHVLRPIPQMQIDRTLPAGSYPQNCGYPGGAATCN
jgi:starch-binding outer membrane protein, SusD/RagB family